jgi:hypothetical protein
MRDLVKSELNDSSWSVAVSKFWLVWMWHGYALVKIADCLGLDPSALIAEFEELTAKNATERSFWADFRVRAEKPLKGFMLALLCALTLLTGLEKAANPVGIFRRFKDA